MSSIKDLAKDAFTEIDKRKGKNRHTNFIKEYQRLVKEQEENKYKSNCSISCDCSRTGCYRYICCDFPYKIEEN